jgi:hypothetical protein
MLGLVISLITVASAATPALPAANAEVADNVYAADTCAQGAVSCELAPVVVQEPREYATPAVIDCRSATVPPVLSTLIGECTGMPPRDTSYRASRYPESEDSQSVSAASHERREGVAACDGLPQKAPALPLSDAQPLALVSKPVIVIHVATGATAPGDAFQLPARFRDPPDRPPRV